MVVDAIRTMINAKDLQPECARVLSEILLMPVFMYDSETVIRMGKEKSRIRAVQMENLRCLLGIMKMDKVQKE